MGYKYVLISPPLIPMTPRFNDSITPESISFTIYDKEEIVSSMQKAAMQSNEDISETKDDANMSEEIMEKSLDIEDEKEERRKRRRLIDRVIVTAITTIIIYIFSRFVRPKSRSSLTNKK